MKPRIHKEWNGWTLRCKQERRMFELFGADAAQREYLRTLPQTFKTWREALLHLCDLYRGRLIIR
jgi:hypothetical protein